MPSFTPHLQLLAALYKFLQRSAAAAYFQPHRNAALGPTGQLHLRQLSAVAPAAQPGASWLSPLLALAAQTRPIPLLAANPNSQLLAASLLPQLVASLWCSVPH